MNGELFALCESLVSRYPRHPTGIPAVRAVCSTLSLDTSSGTSGPMCDEEMLRSLAVWLRWTGDTDEAVELQEQLDEALASGLEEVEDVDEEGQEAPYYKLGLKLSDFEDDWRVVEAGEGYIGTAPKETLPGDVLCVLRACRFPMLLQPVDRHYLVVEPCFMLGFMDGEAKGLVENGQAAVEMPELR